jgi:hypothetical protein
VNHDGFGTPNEVFNRFFWIVRDACREAMAAEWTPAIDAAWTTGVESQRVLQHLQRPFCGSPVFR